jgi:hypothetical protein
MLVFHGNKTMTTCPQIKMLLQGLKVRFQKDEKFYSAYRDEMNSFGQLFGQHLNKASCPSISISIHEMPATLSTLEFLTTVINELK